MPDRPRPGPVVDIPAVDIPAFDIPAFDIIEPDWPAPAHIRAISTTRNGGVSVGRWRSLNLGMRSGDDPRLVSKNHEILQAHLPSQPHWIKQVHGVGVADIDRDATVGPEADAAISERPGHVCAVLTADCLPVLFCDEAGTKVAAAHAGWRGLAAGVLQATVSAMNCEPEKLMAWLGPAIGPQAFEVGHEVYQAYMDADTRNAPAFRPHKDRWLADLYLLARLALARVGVEQVYGGEFCTHTLKEKFFSYRRDGETGRMASLIWIADKQANGMPATITTNSAR